jgi:hypothetical protein
MTTLLKANAQMPATGHRDVPIRQLGSCMQATKEIDFSGPYEMGLAAVLSLPRIKNNGNEDQKIAEVTKTFRGLYEAANGRHVSTPIGPITIAPPVAPWLKDAPLCLETREQFLDLVTNVTGAPQADLSTGNISERSE